MGGWIMNIEVVQKANISFSKKEIDVLWKVFLLFGDDSHAEALNDAEKEIYGNIYEGIHLINF